MLARRSAYALILLLLTGLSGCYLPNKFVLEILKPAQFHFPAEIQKLSVIARMDMNQSYKEERIKETSKEMFSQDSLLTNELMVGLLENIESSPRFELLTPRVTRSLRGKASYPSRPLSWDFVDSICRAKQSDALLSLASMVFSDTTKYVISFSGGNILKRVFYITSYWRFYKLHNWEISEHAFLDSVMFAPEYNGDFRAAFFELAYIAGKESAQRFAPYWDQVSRDYFPLGPGFEHGVELMNNGKALEAIEFWKTFEGHNMATVAASACFNEAVCYEMANVPDSAIKTLEKSRALGVPALYVNRYLSELKKRVQELEIVMKQMNDL
jgi:hypothetical protein